MKSSLNGVVEISLKTQHAGGKGHEALDLRLHVHLLALVALDREGTPALEAVAETTS